MSSHPHVVDLFDAGVTIDGHPFLIMELCQGSYSERMRREPLPPAEVRDVGVKIADALADAHELGVLHRDVKPANILMTHFGEPALADFGLAIVTENRDVSITLDVLTPAYAPPEMFNHAQPASPADVYSLCATLYALLAGRPPRWPTSRDPSLVSLVDMFADPIPNLPHVPRELMELIFRGMSNVEAARPRAAELRDQLLAMELGAVSPQAIAGGMLRHQPGSNATAGGHPADDPESGETQVLNPNRPLAPPMSPGFSGPSSPAYSGPPASNRSPQPVAPVPPGERGTVRTASRQSSETQPERTPRRRLLLMAGIAGCYLLALAAVVAGGLYLGSAAMPTTFVAVPVKSNSPSPTCPLSPAGTAQCVRAPECFNGVTVQSGQARAPVVECTEPHLWEVFATASLPAGLDTASHNAIKQNAAVRQVCSATNAKALSTEQNWQVEVLPPTRDQIRAGNRTYRCLAGKPPSKFRDSRFTR
jgi:hypothetical protein